MSNLAIVVAVRGYDHYPPLPACGNDGKAVFHLLKATGRFDQVLLLDEDTTSSSVKGRISSFIKDNSGGPVEEFLFYFTGHGDFDGVDFQYILTDFNQRKRKQTSLSNDELDGMVRGLSPQLYVKIVDACHSGVSYIKSHEDLSEHLKSIRNSLRNVYFMFSSQNSQYSYQDDKISYFTDSLLKSIVEHSSDTIRYKDIMSYVADDFESRGVQTPVFISQAALTEVFCEITDSIRIDLRKFVQLGDDPDDQVDPSKYTHSMSLLDKIIVDAERYVPKERALEAVVEFAALASAVKFEPVLTQLFDVSTHLEQSNPPGADQIGRWLKPSKDERYFAHPVTETQAYQKRVLKSGSGIGLSIAHFSGLFGTDSNDDLYKWVDAHREVVTGFRFSTDMPFDHIRIRLTPKFPNLTPEEVYIVPIVSRTHLRIFSAFTHFEFYDWDKSKRVGKIEWASMEVSLLDETGIKGFIDGVIRDFQGFVLDPLQAKWTGSVAEINSTE